MCWIYFSSEFFGSPTMSYFNMSTPLATPPIATGIIGNTINQFFSFDMISIFLLFIKLSSLPRTLSTYYTNHVLSYIQNRKHQLPHLLHSSFDTKLPRHTPNQYNNYQHLISFYHFYI